MIDLKLTNDFDLDFDGADFGVVADAAEVAQRARCQLTTHKGEYAYDTNLGLPWLNVLLSSQASNELKMGIIRAKLLNVEGLKRLTAFDVTINEAAHTGLIEFSATTIYNETVDAEVLI